MFLHYGGILVFAHIQNGFTLPTTWSRSWYLLLVQHSQNIKAESRKQGTHSIQGVALCQAVLRFSSELTLSPTTTDALITFPSGPLPTSSRPLKHHEKIEAISWELPHLSNYKSSCLFFLPAPYPPPPLSPLLPDPHDWGCVLPLAKVQALHICSGSHPLIPSYLFQNFPLSVISSIIWIFKFSTSAKSLPWEPNSCWWLHFNQTPNDTFNSSFHITSVSFIAKNLKKKKKKVCTSYLLTALLPIFIWGPRIFIFFF